MSLSAVLQSVHSKDPNYESLFTSKMGCLTYTLPDVDSSRGKWSLRGRNISAFAAPDYYEKLSQHLMHSIYREPQEPAQIPNLEAFVKRFNTVSTKARLLIPEASKVDKYILFNFKSEFSYLSNFFPTLILCPDFDGNGMPMIFSSVEAAYVAHRVLCKKEFAVPMVMGKEKLSINSPNERYDFLMALFDPLRAKKMVDSYVDPDQEDFLKKAMLMKKLVRIKFTTNPILLEELLRTNPMTLIEHTANSFWGDGNNPESCCNDDPKSRLTKNSRNVLGKLLMSLREHLMKREDKERLLEEKPALLIGNMAPVSAGAGQMKEEDISPPSTKQTANSPAEASKLQKKERPQVSLSLLPISDPSASPVEIPDPVIMDNIAPPNPK